MQKNKPYTFTTEDGKQKTLYDGCYACVTAIVFAVENDEVYILANQRGPGSEAVDSKGNYNIGKWNMPCGYVDAGTLEENVARECLEETGVEIDPDSFVLIGAHKDQDEKNATMRYVTVLDGRKPLAKIEELKGGEKNEVSDIQWIKLTDINNYEWAFNHETIMVNAFTTVLNTISK